MRLKVGIKFGGLLYLCFFIACAVGWCTNVYKLTKLDFNAPYKAEIIRGLGAFPVVPMGAIIGYLNIDDTPTVQTIRIVK